MTSANPFPVDRLCGRLTWDDLDPDYLRKLIRDARGEDLEGDGLVSARRPAHPGDATTGALFSDSKPARAALVVREDLIVCGTRLIERVLEAYGPGCTVRIERADGVFCRKGETIATLSGPAPLLLQAERVLLNFAQKLSGVATHTHRYVDALGDSPTKILDTRKTTPGWRMLEKYAVATGGGWNHRLGLFDRVMIKDNHLAASQADAGQRLADAVCRVKSVRPDLPTEVEVDDLDQIPPVLEAGADILLLDNFTSEELARAVDQIGSRAATEASGGITLERLPEIARIGLTFISSGALVHQSTWKDIGLDWSSG